MSMNKAHLNISVDDELTAKAKNKGLNISKITEQAIKDKLEIVDVAIDTTIEKCEFCGREEEKATRDNLKGLTWLYPDERWICDDCLRNKSVRIIPK